MQVWDISTIAITMSTLQITLILLGVLTVLAVIGYNAWFSSRHAPRKARPMSEEEEDEARALAAQDRRDPSLEGYDAIEDEHGAVEPSFDGLPKAAAKKGLFGKSPHSSANSAQDAAANRPSPALAQEAQLQTAHEPAEQGAAAKPAPAQQATAMPASNEFDSLVCSIVVLELDKPVSGDAALAAQAPTRRIGKKQFLVQGFNLQTQQWEAPRAGARYSQFQTAIQLANRQGPLNEIEFSEFVLKSQAFADAIGAEPDFPDMLHEVARGREVDQFAAQNDAILNLMLVAQRATWSPGYVRQTAAQYGFKSSVTPGRLVLPAVTPGSPPVLVLNYDPQAAMADDLDHAPVHEVLFTLDVPNVDRNEHAFERLRSILDSMAAAMDGAVTDPESRKLPAMALDSIGADMERLYEALESRGISAGSPAALRLFS